MSNTGFMSTTARVGRAIAVKNDQARRQLTYLVAPSKGEKIAWSRRVEKHRQPIEWRQIQTCSSDTSKEKLISADFKIPTS